MSNSKFNIQNSTNGRVLLSIFRHCRSPHAPGVAPGACRLTPGGFTYIALLAAIVIIGISLASAGKYWQNVLLREKEEELLFRGDQYRQAIERYYTALPGRAELPPSVDELLKDDRTAAGKRHLRRVYKDPITGEDFEILRDQAQGNRITGVFSRSEKEPLKRAAFPEPYGDFAGKQSYSEWKFVFTVPQPATGATGTRPSP
jgi:type II secretory pathway pseudopilin PulG